MASGMESYINAGF